MAQPIRSSGCLPFTSHSKARGTSGTAGKPLRQFGGGVPAVSDARQTTTPPVSLNLATDSHGVRCGVASSSRCGRLEFHRDQAWPAADRRSTARSRWLVRRSKLSSKKFPIAAAGIDIDSSALLVQGRNSVAADGPPAPALATGRPRRAQQALASQIEQIARVATPPPIRHHKRHPGAAGRRGRDCEPQSGFRPAPGDLLYLRRQRLLRTVWAAAVAAPALVAIAATLFLPGPTAPNCRCRCCAAIGNFFDDSFERRTNQRLRAVTGDPQLASLIAMNSRRPHLLLEATRRRTPCCRSPNSTRPAASWSGARPIRRHAAPELAQRFPGLVPKCRAPSNGW